MKYLKGVSKEVMIVLIHSTDSETSSNEVEGIFKQPILWALEKCSKTLCFNRNWLTNLQNSAGKGKNKVAKM